MSVPERLSVTASSWNELIDALYQGSWHPRLQRFRSRYAFRGMSCVSYPLTTSLMRLGGDYTAVEEHLLRNFRKYAQRDAVARDSLWNWLALAQHHGLPTRVVDWTFSPFVAMHFATANAEMADQDGVIWCADYVGIHRRLPKELLHVQEQVGADVFTVEMLDRVMAERRLTSLAEFDRLAKEPFVVFFEPPSLDDRIVNQYALLSVASSPTAALGDWLAAHADLARTVVLPAALKAEVRDKLDQANVTERVLLPGLDGLARWLARHYGPAGPLRRPLG